MSSIFLWSTSSKPESLASILSRLSSEGGGEGLQGSDVLETLRGCGCGWEKATRSTLDLRGGEVDADAKGDAVRGAADFPSSNPSPVLPEGAAGSKGMAMLWMMRSEVSAVACEGVQAGGGRCWGTVGCGGALWTRRRMGYECGWAKEVLRR